MRLHVEGAVPHLRPTPVEMHSRIYVYKSKAVWLYADVNPSAPQTVVSRRGPSTRVLLAA
jgi:hypothetical protein